MFAGFNWVGHVARMEESWCVFKTVTSKPIGKRPLGILTRKWEEDIKIL